MLSIAVTSVHGLLVAGAVAALVLIVVPYIRAAAHREPEPVPPAMEPVDWLSRESRSRATGRSGMSLRVTTPRVRVIAGERSGTATSSPASTTAAADNPTAT